MLIMSCRRIALLLLLVCSSLAFAQFHTGGAKPEPPQNTVREFCRLDFMGGRLTPEGWKRMKPLTNWKDNPAWRRFRIASRYQQGDEVHGFHSSRIAVRYLMLGEFELGIGYTPLTDPEDIEFKLKETDGEWHIESTDPDTFYPHVSKAQAIQWMQDKLKSTTDAAEKISLESALKQLLPAK